MENEEKEIWKTCKGYPGFEVSTLGNVRRAKQELYAITEDGERELIAVYPAKPIKPFKNGPSIRGYSLNVGYGNAKKQVEVQRIIADTFIGCPDDGQMYSVKHIDGNAYNNRVDNLKYVSYSELLKTAHKNNAENDDMPLKVNVGIHCITTDQYFASIKAASEYFQIPYVKLRKYLHKVSIDDEIPAKWNYDYDFESVGNKEIRKAVQDGKFVNVETIGKELVK